MSIAYGGIAFLGLPALAVAVVHVPLGDYRWHAQTSQRGTGEMRWSN
jgi:hypothetical protein